MRRAIRRDDEDAWGIFIKLIFIKISVSLSYDNPISEQNITNGEIMTNKSIIKNSMRIALCILVFSILVWGVQAAGTIEFVTKWGTLGSGDGQFNGPAGIAVDSNGNIYVADGNNNRIQMFSSDGTFITQWGSYGSGDGQFMQPTSITVDSSNNIYVVDKNNNRIQKFSQGYTPGTAPTFTSITPSSGPTSGNTGVTIRGTNFVSGGLFNVKIGGNFATSVFVDSPLQISAVTPAGTVGPKNVVITNNDGQIVTGTNAYTYTTATVPTFTSITPSSGPISGGTSVTILGGNFVNGGSFGVSIGGVAATNIVLVNANQITAVTPAGTAGSKDVVITNNDGQTATGTNAYTYTSAPGPTFTSITPNSGPTTGGTLVSISGSNFVKGSGFNVQIDGRRLTVYGVSSTLIFGVTPAGTVGSKNVVITNNDGQTVTGMNSFLYT